MSQHKGRVGTSQHTLFDITVGRTQLIPSVMWMGLLLRCVFSRSNGRLPPPSTFLSLSPYPSCYPCLFIFRAHNISKSHVGNQIRLMGEGEGTQQVQHKVGPISTQLRRMEKQRTEDGSKENRGQEERKIDCMLQSSSPASAGNSVPASHRLRLQNSE